MQRMPGSLIKLINGFENEIQQRSAMLLWPAKHQITTKAEIEKNNYQISLLSTADDYSYPMNGKVFDKNIQMLCKYPFSFLKMYMKWLNISVLKIIYIYVCEADL